MRIGVVSDTHGHLPGTHHAVRLLESLEIEAVLHCGDIGSPEVVACFAAWPTHFVFGNCDYDRPQLRAAIEAHGLICHGEFGEIELAGRRIALLHGHDQRRMQQVLHSAAHDLILSGHTHVADISRHGEMLLVNPGAIYRANPHTIAVVVLAPLEATIVPL
jgi:putative phosphoesterase